MSWSAEALGLLTALLCIVLSIASPRIGVPLVVTFLGLSVGIHRARGVRSSYERALALVTLAAVLTLGLAWATAN